MPVNFIPVLHSIYDKTNRLAQQPRDGRKDKMTNSLRQHIKRYSGVFPKIIVHADKVERGRYEYDGVDALYG